MAGPAESVEIDINQVEQTGVVETPEMPDFPVVPASALFGEDPIGKTLEAETQKIGNNQPKRTDDLQRDPTTGKFLPKVPEATKPAVAPAKPVVQKPAAPVAPTTPPTPPPAPAAPAKIKVGGKEYTEEELAKLLAPKPADPVPVQQQPQPQQAPAPKAPEGPTPEQLRGMERDWVAKNAEALDVTIDEPTLEKIVLGGPEGAKALQGIIRTAAATAVLEARKSMFSDLNPVLDEYRQALAPMQQQFVQMERVAAEHEFFHAYPEFAGSDQDRQLAKEVGEALMQQHPAFVAKADRKTFLAEVARQTDIIKANEFKRWFPTAQGTWRDHQKQQAATAAPEVAPVTPAAAPVQAAPMPPKVRPPSANSPSPSPIGMSASKEFQKATAAALANG